MTTPTRKPTTAVDAKATQQMASYRKQDLDRIAHPIKRTDYPEGNAGDAAYRQALLQQYKDLRLTQYDYVVRNESLKTYNLAKRANEKDLNINPNRAWGGYATDHPNALEKIAQEKLIEPKDTPQVACQRDLVEKYAAKNFKNYNDLVKENGGIGANSCAIIAISVQAQISNKMDYCDNNNITNHGNPNITMAKTCYTCAPSQYGMTQSEKGGQTVGQMIRNGTLGVGDEVSIYIPKKDKSGAVTASGQHAITIAGINRDQTGQITGYTIQASNGIAFRDNGFNSYVVCSAIKSHNWMNDRVKDEQKALLIVTPSLEELRAPERKRLEEQEKKKPLNQRKTKDQIEHEASSIARQKRLAIYNQKSKELTPQFQQKGLKGAALTEAVNNAIVADQQQILAKKIAQEKGLSGDELKTAANQEYYARINQDIQDTRQQTEQVITSLQQSEQYAAEHSGYLREATSSYNQELNRRQKNNILQPMQGISVFAQQQEIVLDTNLNTPQMFDKQGNAIWTPKYNSQKQDEPTVYPINKQPQNDGEPVVHPINDDTSAIDHNEGVRDFRADRTNILLVDGNLAQQNARYENARITAQVQQQELAAAEPQKIEDNKQTELTPAMQMYLQNQGRA